MREGPEGARTDQDVPTAEDEDPVDELLGLSDSDPAAAMDWLARLANESLAREPAILFAKFNALRHLATDRLLGGGVKAPGSKTAEEIAELFDPREIELAIEALRAVAEIEEIDPDFFVSRDFAEEKIDHVAAALERVRPGEAQRTLGWTKVAYFGFDRIRFVHDAAESAPQTVLSDLLRTRYSAGRVATHAVFTAVRNDADQGHYADVGLLYRELADGETVGDAMAGILRLHSSKAPEFEPDPVRDEGGLDHPNRERLLEESEMLLRYERDPARIRFLEQTVEWLHGRAARPVLPSEVEAEASRPKSEGIKWGPLVAGGVALVLMLMFLRTVIHQGAAQEVFTSTASGAPAPQSGLSYQPLPVQPPPPQPAIAVDTLTFGSTAGFDGKIQDERNAPPPDPEMLYAQWHYSAAQPGQSYGCTIDGLTPFRDTLRYSDGFITCHWPRPGPGPHHFVLTIADKTDDRLFSVPAAAYGSAAGNGVAAVGTALSSSDSPCPLFSTEVHACALTRTTAIRLAPGSPPGYHYCFPPANAFQKVQFIASDGRVLDLAPENGAIPADGFIFTPIGNPQEIRYWIAASC